MIDKEPEIFTVVAERLRHEFPGIYVVGTELTTTPPKFPSVSLIQTNNSNKGEYSTFNGLENPKLEKSVFFKGQPSAMGLPAMRVNGILETNLYITPTNAPAWENKSTTE